MLLQAGIGSPSLRTISCLTVSFQGDSKCIEPLNYVNFCRNIVIFERLRLDFAVETAGVIVLLSKIFSVILLLFGIFSITMMLNNFTDVRRGRNGSEKVLYYILGPVVYFLSRFWNESGNRARYKFFIWTLVSIVCLVLLFL